MIRSKGKPYRLDVQNRLAAENLKRCPLCGGLNARENGECFVCRWRGRFDRDPAALGEALDDLIDNCPELAEALWREAARPHTSWQRFRTWLQRFRFRRRLDFRI